MLTLFTTLRVKANASNHLTTAACRRCKQKEEVFLLLELFQKGGPLMYPLLICSIVTITIGLERGYHYIKLGGGGSLPPAVKESIAKGDYEHALQTARQSRGPIAAIITSALLHRGDREAMEKAISVKGSLELKRLNEHLHILELIGRLAPMTGLFGTVLGMVAAFQKVAEAKGQVDPSILAGGIWEALLTTAAGLSVALPALILHHFFEDKVGSEAFRMKLVGAEMVNLLEDKRLD